MEKCKRASKVSNFGKICAEDGSGIRGVSSEGEDGNNSRERKTGRSPPSIGITTRSSYRLGVNNKRSKLSVNSASTGESDSNQRSPYGDKCENGESVRLGDSEERQACGGETDGGHVGNQSVGSRDHSPDSVSMEDEEDVANVEIQPESDNNNNNGRNSGQSSRCSSANSHVSASQSPSGRKKKGIWTLVNSPSKITSEDSVDEMARELKINNSHVAQPRSPSIHVGSEKSGSSSASASPTRADSANSLVSSSNNNINKNSHECRQMRCNRNDGNTTETLGTSKNNNKASNNNNNIVEKAKIAPMVFMNNLPYMGELTFDTRPRRGRKPKKADICHLISKNYGIQFPNSSVNVPTSSSSTPRVSTFTSASGASTGVSTKSAKNKPLSTLPNPRRNNNHANLHHQQLQPHSNTNLHTINESNNNKKLNHNVTNVINPDFMNWTHHVPPDLLPLASVNPAAAVALLNNYKGNPAFKKISLYPSSRNFQEQLQQQQEQLQQSLSRLSGQDLRSRDGNAEEPLNLCMRDKNSPSPLIPLDFLSLSSGARGSHEFESGKRNSNAPLFSNFNLKHASSAGSSSASKGFHGNNQVQQGKRGGSVKRGNVTDLVTDDQNLVNLNIQFNLSASKLANYVNSANNNRPMSFGPPCSNFASSVDPRGSASPSSRNLSKNKRKKMTAFSHNNAPSASTPVLTVTPLSGNHMDGSHAGIHHFSSHAQSLSGSMPCHTPVDISNTSSFPSSTSNTAEVSICKFKFTGGAKPSLQEKKMLSLDSTGNFRFYSDKTSGNSNASSMSGCKGNMSGSCSSALVKDDSSPMGELISAHGLPKSAKSMSMCMPVPIPPLSTCSVVSESHSPSLPPMMSPADLECSSSSDGPASSSSSMMMSSRKELSGGHHHHEGEGSGNMKMKMKRKRRTRKSLMREKLEKTFKEKGFLIQTQQLESAEGATYCKFRQLRKFTRYLFRSWKDYLPDNLKGANSTGHDESTGPACVGTQPMLSSDLLESMEQEPCHEDTEEGRSETPDNLTLSPAGGPNHVDENEDENGDELDDKDENIGA